MIFGCERNRLLNFLTLCSRISFCDYLLVVYLFIFSSVIFTARTIYRFIIEPTNGKMMNDDIGTSRYHVRPMIRHIV